MQSDSDIMSAINNLIGSVSNVPTPTIPTLNFSVPSTSDVNSQWLSFLTQAAQDPSIISYYSNLLSQAEGDAQLAINFAVTDYQNGTRDTQQNLAGTLAQEANTETGENQGLQDTLNKRGIALTGNQDGSTTYAGSGEAGTEASNLSSTQALRKEAEVRSATQSIQNAGLSEQKAITSTNQGLQQTANTMQQNEQQDVLNEAQSNMNNYNSGIAAKNQVAVNNQASSMKTGSAGSTTSEPSGAPPYAPNTVNQTVSYNGQTFRGQPGGGWTTA